MQNHLLLLEDIDNLARKGDIVKVKPGFARNYLLPQKKAVVVDKRTLRMQERLREERAKQAVEDKRSSDLLAKQLLDKTFEIKVKVDPDGHMYGSVSANEIVKILEKEGYTITKRNVKMIHGIKTLGTHPITLSLKEGVEAQFALSVISETPIAKKPKALKEVVAEEGNQPEETQKEEAPIK
ncbi:MAG: 50S ribosomal protein L9 [Simkaniaceae bacterium]|nr:50S ribosomal protein L9 [Simkaniaceae bacterium]